MLTLGANVKMCRNEIVQCRCDESDVWHMLLGDEDEDGGDSSE